MGGSSAMVRDKSAGVDAYVAKEKGVIKELVKTAKIPTSCPASFFPD